MQYDVAIIGAGPGGYIAAIRAAQAGLKTVLIEKDNLGGTCLNKGCIPTKVLVAEAQERIDGLSGVENFVKAMARKNKVVESLRGGVRGLLASNKIDYVNSAAQFVNANELTKSDGLNHKSSITSHQVIIATGSSWRPLPNLKPDGLKIVTSDEILSSDKLPKRLTIVGGGVIGCEFASIMQAFGVEITIIEVAGQILPLEDAIIARTLASSFKKRGIQIYTDTTVNGLNGERVMLSNGEEIEADKVLVSVGRRPFTEDLNLEAAGITSNNGFVPVNAFMQTNVKHIYAIGDVASPADFAKPMLAHVASYEAKIAIAHITKAGIKADYKVIPRPIFTRPEIGCVGATDKELKTSGITYKTGRFPYAALSKAVCDDKTEGLLQIYADKKGLILGAHCIGAHATDICSEIALAMKNGMTTLDLANTIHSHPTYSEIIVEAMEDIGGRAVHKAGRR